MAQARDVVRAHLRPTPVVDTPVGTLKLESLQPTGSFKVRGALAALAAAPPRVRAAGVVTASAGNHGLGVAYAATTLGIPATIVVPTTASPVKVAALRAFAVTLVSHGDDYDDAERHALELAALGATFVSAYNDPWVIAGQATIGPELRDELAGPMTVLVPVGGGGLVSGVGLWARDQAGVRVIGVQAQASTAVSAAAEAGRIVTVPIEPTLADGLAGNLEPGSITAELAAAHTHALISVTEPEIGRGIRYLAAHGLVAEGSAAVGVAALLAGRVDVIGRPVALITGRNIALAALASVLAAPD
jgi:threonine dehydratase